MKIGTMTAKDMAEMQARGQVVIEAANTWSDSARDASAEARRSHMGLTLGQHRMQASHWKEKAWETKSAQHATTNAELSEKHAKMTSQMADEDGLEKHHILAKKASMDAVSAHGRAAQLKNGADSSFHEARRQTLLATAARHGMAADKIDSDRRFAKSEENRRNQENMTRRYPATTTMSEMNRKNMAD